MAVLDVAVSGALERRRWSIGGRVQGVGFRPFVYRAAVELGLGGYVANTAGGVVVECQGTAARLDRMHEVICSGGPACASVTRVVVTTIAVAAREYGFEVRPSESIACGCDAAVAVDTAVCARCVEEMRSEQDRRSGYGLINCTDCGPRYSIVRAIPYDRRHTTMAGFEMCPRCRGEYEDPADRRFHAQATACPACGPGVQLVDRLGIAIDGDPIEGAARRLSAGEVLAIKGIGGFHLAVRADEAAAVGRLRGLKKRDAKPLAVMCADLSAARRLARFSEAGERLLTSPAAPIVLGDRVPGCGLAPGVAEGTHRVGVMLPYTPIQHLLFEALGPGAPPLVMTSGNLSDEPLVIDNEDALGRLGSICDALLWHDRPIARPVDDSVVIDMPSGSPLPVRRARGYVPDVIGLPFVADRPGICIGGDLKGAIAVYRGDRVVLSQHLGDLTHMPNLELLRRTVRDLLDLFEIDPKVVACDLHPLYVSGGEAARLAAEWGVPLVRVQHHHAHAAAVLAEHGVTDEALALVCDGTGYGGDGTTWGGELLRCDLRQYRRLGRLAPLSLPGGDAAARDTRRCALALMRQAFGEEFASDPGCRQILDRLFPRPQELELLCGMIEAGVNCPQSSGAGRVFDGAAALLGLCARNRFEAEAAMALEAAAGGHPAGAFCGGGLYDLDAVNDLMELDLAPLVRVLVREMTRGVPAGALACAFHEQLARGLSSLVLDGFARTGLWTVVLSGGVFCNALLTGRVTELLEMAGLRVLRHRVVPPNDGGLALGQAAIAAASSGCADSVAGGIGRSAVQGRSA